MVNRSLTLLQQKSKAEQQELIEELNYFNNLCNLILRRDSQQSLSFSELVALATPLCKKLGIVDEVEINVFVQQSVLLNVHRHPPLFVRALIKGAAIAGTAALGLGLGLILAGFYEFYVCISNHRDEAPEGLLYAVLLLRSFKYNPNLFLIFALAFASHQSMRFVIQYGCQVNTGDSIESTTHSFTLLKKHWQRHFPDLDFNFVKSQKEEFEIYNQRKYTHAEFIQYAKQQLNHYQNFAESILFVDPNLIADQDAYQEFLKAGSTGKILADQRVEFGVLRQRFAGHVPYNEQCPISQQYFRNKTKVIGLRSANGNITLYDEDSLKKWLFHHSLANNESDPLINLRPLFVRKQDLIG